MASKPANKGVRSEMSHYTLNYYTLNDIAVLIYSPALHLIGNFERKTDFLQSSYRPFSDSFVM
tara:strand:+ start:259 stop:447 length:189 start_codon:yes stop_codon:yes gene_type:complete